MPESNPNARLEMFCDGVFAIAITILILDMKVPPLDTIHSIHDVWHAVANLWPSFFALCLSFIIIFISWVGHHNIFLMLDKTSPQFQFANGFFLFTVIFIPFAAAFMAEYMNTPYAQPAIIFYCLAGTFHNLGWNMLHLTIGKPVPLVKAGVGMDRAKKYRKGSMMGFGINVAIILLALWIPYVAIVLNLMIWIYWLILSVSVKHESEV